VHRADVALQELAQRGAAVQGGLDRGVRVPAARGDLVGAGVVEAVREEGGQVVDDVGDDLVRLGRQRVELPSARLRRETVVPVAAGQPELARAGDGLRVRAGPRRRVA